MNVFSKILKVISGNIGIIISAILTFIFGWITLSHELKNPRKIKLREKQLFNVYLPLFQYIESIYCQSLTSKQQNEIIQFIDKLVHKEYIFFFANTLNYYQIFKRSLTTESFKNFCINVDFHYEKLKTILGYPKRTLSYRLNNLQYSSNLMFWLLMMKYLILHLILYLLGVFIILSLLVFIHQILSKIII